MTCVDGGQEQRRSDSENGGVKGQQANQPISLFTLFRPYTCHWWLLVLSATTAWCTFLVEFVYVLYLILSMIAFTYLKWIPPWSLVRNDIRQQQQRHSTFGQKFVLTAFHAILGETFGHSAVVYHWTTRMLKIRAWWMLPYTQYPSVQLFPLAIRKIPKWEEHCHEEHCC